MEFDNHNNFLELRNMFDIIRSNESDMIQTVKYGLLSDRDIDLLSSFKISLSDIIDNYKPTFKGSGISFIDNNPYLGVTEKDQICPTCNQNGYKCNGHFASIELPYSSINVLYLDIVVKILNSVCILCGRLKYDNDLESDESQIKKISKDSRLEFLEKKCIKYNFCFLCYLKFDICSKLDQYFEKNFKFKLKNDRDKKVKYIICNVNKKDCLINYDSILNIFKKINQDTSKILGIGENKPEYFIMKKILLLPAIIRPSLQDGSELYLDPLSKSYGKLIDKIYYYAVKKLSESESLNPFFDISTDDIDGIEVSFRKEINNRNREIYKNELLTHINLTDENILNIINDLFVSYSSDNRFKLWKSLENIYIGMPTDSMSVGDKGNPSIMSKLDGKFGFIRRQMMGKRVNYTARTVVGPAPNFNVNEIGVPKFIADNMPVRFKVTNINYNEVLELYKKDQLISVIKKIGDNEVRELINKNKPFKIKIGDQVERKLHDGDYVLANRNPTIHKYNMLGLRAKVIDEPIFRLNLALTGPYNADFDGDEFNIHVPQTLQAQSELSTFVSAEQCYGDITSSKMMAGLVFDAITGLYIMTQDWIFIEPDNFQEIISNVNFPGEYMKTYKNYFFGINLIKNKIKKLVKSIDIVYEQLMIYVPMLNDFKRYIRTSLENDFLEKIVQIKYESFNDDFSKLFINKIDDNLIELKDKIYQYIFKNFDSNIFRKIIILRLKYIIFNLINTENINISKNEFIYIQMFIEKLAFYYYLINNAIDKDIDSEDENDTFYDNCLKNNVDIFSGKSLFSLIIPLNLNYEKFKNGNTPLETYTNSVKIKKGILCQGTLNKDHLGNSTNSIPHVLNLYHTYDAVTFFLTYAQRLVNYWFYKIGFSLSLNDCKLNENFAKEIERDISLIRAEAYNIENINILENEKEEKIIFKLQEIQNLNSKLINDLEINNPFLIMAELAKAKGKGANLIQISASIGQQFYGGKRIPNDLIYFKKDDPDPASKGLVINSFCNGMTPSEFIFHMYSSREGIAESVEKVGECGFLHIQMAKMLEIINVKEDSSVRTKTNRIIQFIYGDDGFDSSELSKIKLNNFDFFTFINVSFIANQFNNEEGIFL